MATVVIIEYGDTLFKLFGPEWDTVYNGGPPVYCNYFGVPYGPINDICDIRKNTFILCDDAYAPDPSRGAGWYGCSAALGVIPTETPPTVAITGSKEAITDGDTLLSLTESAMTDYPTEDPTVVWYYFYVNGLNNSISGGAIKISDGNYGPHYTYSKSTSSNYEFDIPAYTP